MGSIVCPHCGSDLEIRMTKTYIYPIDEENRVVDNADPDHTEIDWVQCTNIECWERWSWPQVHWTGNDWVLEHLN